MLTENFHIRRAQSRDASVLTAIAFAAKRHWNYPEEWIQLWANELTVDGYYIDNNWVVLAEQDDRTVGWCALTVSKNTCWIDYCWVLPDAAGRGIGRALVEEAMNYAAEPGLSSIKVIADPHAEGFYQRMGFTRIGEHPSVPSGRVLPILEARTST